MEQTANGRDQKRGKPQKHAQEKSTRVHSVRDQELLSIMHTGYTTHQGGATACIPGQASRLHASSSVSAGQAAPPAFAGVSMARVRERVPPPHVAVHLDHNDHGPATQGTARHALKIRFSFQSKSMQGRHITQRNNTQNRRSVCSPCRQTHVTWTLFFYRAKLGLRQNRALLAIGSGLEQNFARGHLGAFATAVGVGTLIGSFPFRDHAIHCSRHTQARWIHSEWGQLFFHGIHPTPHLQNTQGYRSYQYGCQPRVWPSVAIWVVAQWWESD
jgi:hypothetical protein